MDEREEKHDNNNKNNNNKTNANTTHKQSNGGSHLVVEAQESRHQHRLPLVPLGGLGAMVWFFQDHCLAFVLLLRR